MVEGRDSEGDKKTWAFGPGLGYRLRRGRISSVPSAQKLRVLPCIVTAQLGLSTAAATGSSHEATHRMPCIFGGFGGEGRGKGVYHSPWSPRGFGWVPRPALLCPAARP